ncbi:MAG: InlB B-repeat-containing protein [Planctomycetota bacterium]|jgi:hypothetical protein
MLKRSNVIFIGWRGLILVIAVLTAGLAGPAYCQSDGIALLLQQTPSAGGTVTPAIGLHSFDQNTDVTLTAKPKPGYQFVYWIGNVSDPTATKTIAYMDAPKIIIAVFERSEYDLSIVEESPSISFGGGGMLPHAPDYARGGGGGGGGRRPPIRSRPPEPEPPEPDENLLIPEETPAVPVPELPEPATILLLGAGTVFLFRQKRESQ